MGDEFAMMEEFTYKSESVGTTKESELDNVIDHKHAVKDDKKSQEEYIGEIENVQEDKSVENKIEEIKVKKIEEDELFENKIKSIHEDKHDFEEHVLPVKEVQQENKIESLHEDKYDFEEQAQPVKEVQKEEPFNLSTIENEPSIDTKITTETVSSSIDGIASTTTTTERREVITDEDGRVQECVVVEKVTKQEVTVPSKEGTVSSEKVQISEAAKDFIVDGQLQDQSGTTISERRE